MSRHKARLTALEGRISAVGRAGLDAATLDAMTKSVLKEWASTVAQAGPDADYDALARDFVGGDDSGDLAIAVALAAIAGEVNP